MAGKSSARWLKEHFSDPFVKQAQKEGFRSRAAYKLLEIDDKHHFLKPGHVVVDLGAAPGGWSQVAVKRVGSKGLVLALDILAMDAIPNVTFLQGDFSDNAMAEALAKLLPEGAHVVLSDMAPNMSGHDSVDVPRALELVELAFEFAKDHLHEDGVFLVKVFQGAGFDAFYAEVKRHFAKTTICKPKASRGRSREIYVLAKGFQKPLRAVDDAAI